MHMRMVDGLPGGGARVEEDLITIGLGIELLVQQGFCLVHQGHEVVLFREGAIKPGGHMATGDDEQMAPGRWLVVRNGKTKGIRAEPLGWSNFQEG